MIISSSSIDGTTFKGYCRHCAYASLFPLPVVFDNYTVDTDQSNTIGGVIKITGTLLSKINVDYRVLPYTSLTVSSPGPFYTDDSTLDQFLYSAYPLYGEQGSWYFRTESNLTGPVTLKPGQHVNFEINLYPLKAGSYSPRTLLMTDYGDLTREITGSPVKVSGSNAPTLGEITQLYLPIALGFAILIGVALKVLRLRMADRSISKAERIVRLIFAISCAIQSVWLSGLLFWLGMSGYYLLSGFEPLFAKIVGSTLALAAVTVGSYFASISTSSKSFWRIVAIGTAIAGIVFYLLMTSNFYGFVPFVKQFEWRGFSYPLSNIGSAILSSAPVFMLPVMDYPLFFFLFYPFNVNIAIGVYIFVSWLRERRKPTRFARRVMAR